MKFARNVSGFVVAVGSRVPPGVGDNYDSSVGRHYNRGDTVHASPERGEDAEFNPIELEVLESRPESLLVRSRNGVWSNSSKPLIASDVPFELPRECVISVWLRESPAK